ncbi:tetratricopeptide repeat protein [Alkalispirochaeta americana]|uniref:tetratricopeptide repeat protein n=1 Tax=Alkalispirochaeta americana TaxID=159291 RepID=UPI0013564B5C|nr:tetratricopeptide repeat protein [Alkalispirochaeta americana]
MDSRSSRNRGGPAGKKCVFIVNIPGIACCEECIDELLDTLPHPPGLICSDELSPETALDALVSIDFIAGVDAAADFFLDIFPFQEEIIDAVALRLYQEGAAKKAYSVLEYGLRNCASTERLQLEMASFMGMDGDPHHGLQVIADVPEDTPRYHVIKGNLLRHLDRWDEAALCWDVALTVDPAHEVAWFNLGDYLFMNRKYAEAEQHFREACRIFPEERRFRVYLGDAFFFQDLKARALQEYIHALELPGRDPAFDSNLQGKIDRCESGS